jgi:hypothetical protein
MGEACTLAGKHCTSNEILVYSNVFTSAIAKMVIRTAVFVAYFLQKLIASYPIFGIASLHNLGIL